MFGFFKRKKKGEDDPLSDLKTVSRWMQELPTGDIYTAQERVVQSLIQFNHADLPMSKERLQVLMHLDEQARDMQHSLCTQYLRNPRMSKVIESRLWTSIHAFYWEITRGYHAFLMDFVANPGGSKIQAVIPVLTARAICGFADIFKWRYFRYERADEKLWLRLHNLYRIAEFDNFQTNRFKLYTTDGKPSSCMEEYVQALLLAPLGAGSLTPKQIEMVDHWLDNWSELTPLDSSYDAERHFFMVDTAQGQALRRIRPNTSPEPSYRFINTFPLLERLEETERALKSGALPPSLGLGEEFRLPDGYDLLTYAAGEWAANSVRDRRASERKPTSGRCEVVRDLSNISNRIRLEMEIAHGTGHTKHMSHEEILDIKLYGFVTERTKSALSQRQASGQDTPVERWPLHDRSETGIGLVLKTEESEWVKVGKLLALRHDPAENWRIGIIRRITRQDGETRTVGIQTVEAVPRLVQLEPAEDKEQSYSVDDAEYSETPQSDALIFPTLAGSDVIVMESSKYAYARIYKMRDMSDVKSIRLEAAQDKGEGWLMARFIYQEQEPVQ